jgi:hypothetical protein
MVDLGLTLSFEPATWSNFGVDDVTDGDHCTVRAMAMQQSASIPFQFEITHPTVDAVSDWVKEAGWTPWIA